MSELTHTFCLRCGAVVPLRSRPTARHCGQPRREISAQAAEVVRRIWQILRAKGVPQITGIRILDAIDSAEVGPTLLGCGQGVLDELTALAYRRAS